MIKSDQINELGAALVKAQAEITTAKKDNQAYGYNYADLGTVIEAVKPSLNKNGISFIQLVEESNEQTVKVTTLLVHSSGQYIGSTGSTGIPEMKGCNLAQRAGAAQSYLKRYQLQALTGLPTEDNDASSEGFSKPSYNKPVQSSTPKVEVKTEVKSEPVVEKKGFGKKVEKVEVKVEESNDDWD